MEASLADPQAAARESRVLPVRLAQRVDRRSREALLDVGRHLLAKLAATGVTEYKAVGRSLGEHGVLDAQTVDLLVKLAGYRNRMVHFYHESARSPNWSTTISDQR